MREARRPARPSRPPQPGGDVGAARAIPARSDEAGGLEAELLEHSRRGRVIDEVRRLEPGKPEGAGNVDQRGASLGREAAAPVRTGDPIAHLDRARRPPAEPARADQLGRAGAALEDQQRGQDGIARGGEEGFRVAQAVGPRHDRQVARDGRVRHHRGKRRRVFGEPGPQQQSWRSREHHSSPHARRVTGAGW